MKITNAFFALLLLFFCSGYAQQPNNGGFENWSNARPVGWATYDGLAYDLGKPLPGVSVKDTLDKHSGKASIRLKSDTALRPDKVTNYSGSLFYGKLSFDSTSNTESLTYTPFTSRPDSIVFWYKYQPGLTGNTAVMSFELYNSFNKVGDVQADISESNVWKRASHPIEYLSTNSPDSLFWAFWCSFEDPALAKAILWLDDVALVYNSVGIMKLDADDLFSIFPNPVMQEIVIKTTNALQGEVTIIDFQGREILKQLYDVNTSKLSLDELPSGTYVIRFFDIQSRQFADRKFLKE